MVMSEIHAQLTIVALVTTVFIGQLVSDESEFLWIRQPSNMTVIAGSDVFIPCEFSGAGRALPHWRHNSDIFYSLSVPPGYQYDFNRSGLIVMRITQSMNMDRYSCFVDLFTGYFESTLGLIIVLPMRMTHAESTSIKNVPQVTTYGAKIGVTNTATKADTGVDINQSMWENTYYYTVTSKGPSSSVLAIAIVAPVFGITVGVFTIAVGLSMYVIKIRRKKIIPNDHLYDMPKLSDPVYEQIYPTEDGNKIKHRETNHAPRGGNTCRPTDEAIIMTECPAYA